ncbi:MAG: hypothetical protein PHV02_15105 [Rhodocyclaceae bacterium]|nr:hypothetical protein [Rhodocyclaceae bacterium]
MLTNSDQVRFGRILLFVDRYPDYHQEPEIGSAGWWESGIAVYGDAKRSLKPRRGHRYDPRGAYFRMQGFYTLSEAFAARDAKAKFRPNNRYTLVYVTPTPPFIDGLRAEGDDRPENLDVVADAGQIEGINLRRQAEWKTYQEQRRQRDEKSILENNNSVSARYLSEPAVKILADGIWSQSDIRISYIRSREQPSEFTIRVKDFDYCSGHARATEVGGEDDKPHTFAIKKIVWVEDPSTARRIENPLSESAVKFVSRYREKIEDRENYLAAVRSADPSVLRADVTLRQDGEYFVEGNGRAFAIEAPSILAANLFVAQLGRTVEDYHGGIWALIDVIVEAEIDWPAWRIYRTHVIRCGGKARGARPKLEDQDVNRTIHGNIPAEAYLAQNGIYAGISVYRPNEVPEAEYFEYPLQSFRTIYLTLRSLTAAARCEYVKKASNSERIFPKDANPFEGPFQAELERFHYVVGGGQADLVELLMLLPQSALYQPIKRSGVKPDAYEREAYVEFYKQNLGNGDLLRALRMEADEHFRLIQPPKLVNWQQFKMFRQQLKWMARAILDWHRGVINEPFALRILGA